MECADDDYGSSNETLLMDPHSLCNNTSPVTKLPATSIHAAIQACAHISLEVTSTHGKIFSLTHSFKGDALLNVNHSTPITVAKVSQIDDDPFEPNSDSDGDESDEEETDAHDNHDMMAPMDLNSPSDLADPLSCINQCSIHVDPIFNLTICLDCAIAILWHKMWGHHHKQAYLLSRHNFDITLQWLEADAPKDIPNSAVFAINGMKIIPDLVKCAIEHKSILLSRRVHNKTIGHQIGTFRGDMRYFEVDPLSIESNTDALKDVLAFVNECVPHEPETQGPLLAQINWEHHIENVDLKTLRETASMPDGKPEFQYLIKLTRQYYKNIAANLGRLSTLTLRMLLSTSPSGELEKAPFQWLQEDPTIKNYGAFVAKFIIFLIRHLCHLVENFDVPLHPQHTTNLTTLHMQLQSGISNPSPAVDLLWINSIHEVMFSLLTHVSPQFLKNEMKDLFMLFRITYHLSNNFGNTNNVSQVPPTISEAQWCFWAMAAAEIYMKIVQFNDNSFEFALPLKKFKASVESSIVDMKEMMDSLFRGCEWQDILEYIDTHTDPTDSDKWFLDRPQQLDQNTSIFTFQENSLIMFTPFLLTNEQVTWEWIAILNELVLTTFYCVVSTWGGGACGMECNHLKFQVNGQGQRQLFMLNGLLTISISYMKTASIKGHGNLIDGSPMDMNQFPQSLTHITLHYLGQGIGIRDWRQVMSTMLINISKADFGILDVEDRELLAIHQAFGYSQAVGEAHYSLQTTNALTQISHTTVTSMQRVSKHWHATIGQHENCTILETKQLSGNSHVQIYNWLLGPLKFTIYNATHQAIMSMDVEIIDKLRNVATGMGNRILRGMQDMFGHYISVNPATALGASQMISSPHLTVNPNLIDTLRPLFPGNPMPSFTSPQQVELMQSCLTNEHILCVMPTGSSKSLAFFVAPLLHPHGLFIVITPLIALTEDMARCHNIPYFSTEVMLANADPTIANQLDKRVNVEEKKKSELPLYYKPECDEHLGVLPMMEFMKTEGCQRLTVHHFDPNAHSCASATSTLLCDNCKHLKKPSSIKPVAAAINNKYTMGMAELRVLKHILDTIKTVGCVHCWVSKVMSLLIKCEDTTFWLYCYKCWVPFQEPCMHPSVHPGSLSDHQSCPYSAQIPFILPLVVTVIQEIKVVIDGQSKNPYLDRIAKRLAVDSTNPASLKSSQT
ncbi:hypothetical protein EDB19DRAFT_1827120 [Suillus lakei]|nr:hypothetical protein EDB19DRAFT_1827120 [Suillus lakei]